MSITITFGPWLIPAAISMASVLAVSFVAFSERNESGFGAGFFTLITLFATVPATICAWVVYFCAVHLK